MNRVYTTHRFRRCLRSPRGPAAFLLVHFPSFSHRRHRHGDALPTGIPRSVRGPFGGQSFPRSRMGVGQRECGLCGGNAHPTHRGSRPRCQPPVGMGVGVEPVWPYLDFQATPTILNFLKCDIDHLGTDITINHLGRVLLTFQSPSLGCLPMFQGGEGCLSGQSPHGAGTGVPGVPKLGRVSLHTAATIFRWPHRVS